MGDIWLTTSIKARETTLSYGLLVGATVRPLGSMGRRHPASTGINPVGRISPCRAASRCSNLATDHDIRHQRRRQDEAEIAVRLEPHETSRRIVAIQGRHLPGEVTGHHCEPQIERDAAAS